MNDVTRQDVERFWNTAEPGKELPNYIKTHGERFADLATRVRRLALGAKVLDVGGTPRTKAIIGHFAPCSDYVLTPKVDLEIDHWSSEIGTERFDVALCTEVIEHMNADPAFLLQQANSTLRLGGTLLLTTVNIGRRASFYNLANGLAPYKMGEVFGTRGDRHHREYAAYELQLLVAANGFSVRCETKDLYAMTPHDQAAAAWVASNVAGLNDRFLGDTIILTATKVEHLQTPSRIYPIYHKSMCDNPNGAIDPVVRARCLAN